MHGSIADVSEHWSAMGLQESRGKFPWWTLLVRLWSIGCHCVTLMAVSVCTLTKHCSRVLLVSLQECQLNLENLIRTEVDFDEDYPIKVPARSRFR